MMGQEFMRKIPKFRTRRVDQRWITVEWRRFVIGCTTTCQHLIILKAQTIFACLSVPCQATENDENYLIGGKKNRLKSSQSEFINGLSETQGLKRAYTYIHNYIPSRGYEIGNSYAWTSSSSYIRLIIPVFTTCACKPRMPTMLPLGTSGTWMNSAPMTIYSCNVWGGKRVAWAEV